MKVAINRCFGGFGLSALAVKRIAERKGRSCFFFSMRGEDGKLNFDHYRPISLEQADKEYMFCVFDIPNPNEVLTKTDDWHNMSMEDRKKANDLYASHELAHDRQVGRNDPDLIAVIEELGEKANGAHAKLEIVEIPDDVQWEIDEYDGNEHVAETHRTWR